MPVVKVWNDNVHPHKESLKGTEYVIPAQGFIEMEYEEAIDLKGQYTGIAPPMENGEPDPRFFKMLRVDNPPPNSVYKDDGLVNHVTGKRAASAEELRAVLAEYRELLITDPEAEKAAAPRESSEVAELRAQVAELTALVKGSQAGALKKKPGPRAKGA